MGWGSTQPETTLPNGILQRVDIFLFSNVKNTVIKNVLSILKLAVILDLKVLKKTFKLFLKYLK
jgi:hypothetical protein